MKNFFLLLAAAALAHAAPAAKAKAPNSGKLATVDAVRAAESRQPEFYEGAEIATPGGEVNQHQIRRKRDACRRFIHQRRSIGHDLSGRCPTQQVLQPRSS